MLLIYPIKIILTHPTDWTSVAPQNWAGYSSYSILKRVALVIIFTFSILFAKNANLKNMNVFILIKS